MEGIRAVAPEACSGSWPVRLRARVFAVRFKDRRAESCEVVGPAWTGAIRIRALYPGSAHIRLSAGSHRPGVYEAYAGSFVHYDPA